MDPQAAWDEMLSAYRDRDPERVQPHADALNEWLQKGGFPPNTGAGPAMGMDWHRRLTQAGVAFCLEYVATWEEE